LDAYFVLFSVSKEKATIIFSTENQIKSIFFFHFLQFFDYISNLLVLKEQSNFNLIVSMWLSRCNQPIKLGSTDCINVTQNNKKVLIEKYANDAIRK
jgi:hypothetical protein